jgi:hypothetical protein
MLRFKQLDGFVNDLGNLHGQRTGRLLADQVSQPADDLSSSKGFLPDVCQNAGQLF